MKHCYYKIANMYISLVYSILFSSTSFLMKLKYDFINFYTLLSSSLYETLFLITLMYVYIYLFKCTRLNKVNVHLTTRKMAGEIQSGKSTTTYTAIVYSCRTCREMLHDRGNKKQTANPPACIIISYMYV